MIEVGEGEYVRTKQGYIAKALSKDEQFIHFDREIYCDGYEEMPLLPISVEELGYIITKHSFNLIDLIEVRRLCKWKKSVRKNRESILFNFKF